MKLIFCMNCFDLVHLKGFIQRCQCGESYGQYTDELQATYGGEKCIPVGINNHSFISALKNQPEGGMGKRFEAFVIPKACPTMKKE